jgi:site-specific recombinase XerD
MSTAPHLGQSVQTFFGDYLTAQRDVSPNTILSYRDALKLFLQFVAKRKKRAVAALGFGDMGSEVVLAFLADLEVRRKCSARTRNARLAALHTFFRYVAAHEPQVLELCQRISAIPVKKVQQSSPVYLETDEMTHILSVIDRSTPMGRRDHLLLLLLFETGARAQEIATLRTRAIRFAPPYQLQILGKGRKERMCPLRARTLLLMRENLRDRGVRPQNDEAIFIAARGEPLTRHGILRVVQRHVRQASVSMPTLATKRVGAHTLRHTAAIHLLRAGNALPVIRSWLGHVSVTTTDRYTEVDLNTKRRALDTTPPLDVRRRRPSWKKADLLAWLEAL